MDTTDLEPLLEDLEVNIDELEQALEPLLSQNVASTASSLPLLDRAKLYATSVYAIETLLYNRLNLAGIDPKTHAVKTELDRCRQYFAKISEAENPAPKKRENLALDKPAAARFITAALRGNDHYDRERSDREAKDRAGAEAKLHAMDARKNNGTDNTGKGSLHKKSRKRKSEALNESHPTTPLATRTEDQGVSTSEAEPTPDVTRRHKSHQPPRTRQEIGHALKQGPLPDNTRRDSKKKKKRTKTEQSI